jgi:hypothetical protein
MGGRVCIRGRGGDLMGVKQHGSLTASCRCGAVVLEVTGAPIVHAACYCASCQEAGRRIEQLPDAPPILDADGGTGFVLYRKDRVRCMQGGERLEAHRLKPKSPTRRMVAACCNSAMFLDFTKGHWLTLYHARMPTGKLMWKLLAAWVLMGFRTPKVEGVPA